MRASPCCSCCRCSPATRGSCWRANRSCPARPGCCSWAHALTGRPLIYTLARKLNAGKPELLAEWDERWRTQPQFRRRFLKLSAVVGGVLLADAIVRLVLVYLLPVDVMANLSPVLHVGSLAVLVGWGLWYRKRAVEQAHAR